MAAVFDGRRKEIRDKRRLLKEETNKRGGKETAPRSLLKPTFCMKECKGQKRGEHGGWVWGKGEKCVDGQL